MASKIKESFSSMLIDSSGCVALRVSVCMKCVEVSRLVKHWTF